MTAPSPCLIFFGNFLISVATLGSQAPAQGPADSEFVLVSGEDAQPGGPVYSYRIGRFEVTTAEYAAFLNRAMNSPTLPEGEYLYFDVDSGDVFIGPTRTGQKGTSGTGTLIFRLAASPRMGFVGQIYAPMAGYEDHPVAGVSWFGALKYANAWTLGEGFSVNQRAYTEGAAPEAWHPATISDVDWISRDLNAEEAERLLDLPGYRLPMSGPPSGGGATPFDEWYKAAAWDQAEGRNHDYGFGRDIDNPPITGADANYRDSRHPYWPGTTPVGFFDGRNVSGFQTRADENHYGLYDASGNVREWMQTRGAGLETRQNRGGGHLSSEIGLLTDGRQDVNAAAADDAQGFRLVQSVPGIIFVLPEAGASANGPWGGPYQQTPSEIEYTITNLSMGPIELDIFADADWLALSGFSNEAPLPPGESLTISVAIAPPCDSPLAAGLHEAALVILDKTHEQRHERTIMLGIEESLSIVEMGDFIAEAEVGGPPQPPTMTYTLRSISESQVSWLARGNDTGGRTTEIMWLTLNGREFAEGELAPLGESTLTVGFAPEVMSLPEGVYTMDMEVEDRCTGSLLTRSVQLTLIAPFKLEPKGELEFSGVFGGPFPPSPITLTATSQVARPVDMTASISPMETDWLDVFPKSARLDAKGATAEFRVSIVGQPKVGEHEAVIRFSADGGYEDERTARLTVTDLDVTPEESAEIHGPSRGPYAPASVVYTIHNHGEPNLDWLVQSSAGWLTLQPRTGTISDPDGVADITVTPNAKAEDLPVGEHKATLTFRTSTGAEAMREVILTLTGDPEIIPNLAPIPDTDAQPGGPTHFFRVGRFEVMNAEFILFLNDALRHLNDGRGEYLYFNLNSPVVYLNNKKTGEIGNGSGTGVALFDGGVGKHVTFDGSRFTVQPGYESHPVVGASWIAAAKYCNWLTLIQGMPESERVYVEAGDPNAWRPADPSPIARLGFRLPADDGQNAVSPLNEWYKAAAWSEAEKKDRLYAFGRDALADGQDANYYDSGDPFDDGTTPVGYYDGTNHGGAYQTRKNDNPYGLFDLCGNVAEWIHDVDEKQGGCFTRGGHFLLFKESVELRNDDRSPLDRNATLGHVGFRVAQSMSPLPLKWKLTGATRFEGYAGGPFEISETALRATNPNAFTHDDFLLSAQPAWLSPPKILPKLIPPGGQIELALSLADVAIEAPAAPAPAGMALMLRDAAPPPPAPDYELWVDRTEVTNAAFAAFLNDALKNLNNERGFYLYFDTLTGRVYLNDEETGKVGPHSGAGLILFDPDVGGRIRFQSQTYTVATGYADHPIVGASWYGALKYCNWRTLRDGLPVTQRAYHEGPSKRDWRPVTANPSDWAEGLFTPAQRQVLAASILGYRLPMDDESAAASPYNEWSRFGAWDPRQEAYRDYGFGRDRLRLIDANFYANGDTAVDGTTPVGFFNGVNKMADGLTFTAYGDHPLRLADLSGNVAEWMQDFAIAGQSGQRVTRGGSWRTALDVDLNLAIRVPLAPEELRDDVGFRVVRSTGLPMTLKLEDRLLATTETPDLILDAREPLLLTPAVDWQFSIFATELAYAPGRQWRLTNRSDVAWNWSTSAGQAWLSFHDVQSGLTQGTLEPGENAFLRAELTSAAVTLASGEHHADFDVQEAASGRTLSRHLILTVLDPLTVEPQADGALKGIWQGPFGRADGQPGPLTYVLTNPTNRRLDFEFAIQDAWLEAAAGFPISGTLNPSQTVNVGFTAGVAAAALGIGDYRTLITFTVTDPSIGRSFSISRAVALAVEDPVRITPVEPWVIPCVGGENCESTRDYTLINRHASIPMNLAITPSVSWLMPLPAPLDLAAGETLTITASIDPAAVASLPKGRYDGIITFDNRSLTHTQTRSVELDVREDLAISPRAPWRMAMPRSGGPLAPSRFVLVHNLSEAGDVQWKMTLDPPTPWLRLDGGSSAGGRLKEGESAFVHVEVDAQAAAALPAGLYGTDIVVKDQTHRAEHRRSVSLDVVEPHFILNLADVPTSSVQPGGPVHSYQMAPLLVTNSEFAAFLNDARSHKDTARGSYLYHDLDSGDVFINSEELGNEGTTGSGTYIYHRDDGRIFYDTNGSLYKVDPGYENHPVIHISWYGAMKYCNWLTLDQGMGVDQRCYVEGPADRLADWRPIVFREALGGPPPRSLVDSERAPLTALVEGYRLPMDAHLCPLGNCFSDAPGLYNEWYKAAAWNGQYETRYGFGRESINPLDANYNIRPPGWPPEFDKTSPVGFFDGVNQVGGSPTGANDNVFGLFDMSGNVFEFMQDPFAKATPTRIALRGGAYENSASGVETIRRASLNDGSTSPKTGFRVARSLVLPASGDSDHDGDVDSADWLQLSACLEGPDKAALPACRVFDFDADGRVDLADAAEFANRFFP